MYRHFLISLLKNSKLVFKCCHSIDRDFEWPFYSWYTNYFNISTRFQQRPAYLIMFKSIINMHSPTCWCKFRSTRLNQSDSSVVWAGEQPTIEVRGSNLRALSELKWVPSHVLGQVSLSRIWCDFCEYWFF